MIDWKKYPWIFYTTARSNLAYIGEVVSRTIFLGVVLYIFLQIWQLTYQETGSRELGGLTLTQMLWYLGITESIAISRPLVAKEVDQDIRTGTIAVLLIRPMSYPIYRLCTYLGERFVRFTINAIVACLIAWLFVDLIPLNFVGLIIFALSIPFAFILDFLFTFFIGLFAFWLEDTSGIMLIYSRISMIFGGMLIPIELFPENFQFWLQNLPFSTIIYGPARLFVQPNLRFFYELLFRQIISITVLSLCVIWVYGVGVKRINSNGG